MSAPSRLLAALAAAALLSVGALALPAPAHAGTARASVTRASTAHARTPRAARAGVVRPTAGQATVPPDCSALPGAAARPANVGAPHSPQLLRQLAGPGGSSGGSRTAGVSGTSGGSRAGAANGTGGLAAAGLGTAAGPPALDPAAASPAAPPGAVRGVDVAAFQHPVSAQYRRNLLAADAAARQEKWVCGRGSGVPSSVMSTFSL
jgi:hypothetical protein